MNKIVVSNLKLKEKSPKVRQSIFPRVGLLITLSLLIFYSSCRKAELPKEKAQNRKTMSGSAQLKIDLSDVVAKLPATIMYNLGSDAKLYTSRTEWQYSNVGLIMRIPTTQGNNNYLYATKTYDKPDQTNVYAVKFIPNKSSPDTPFNGKQVWLDFQQWKGYGIEYKDGVPISYLEPQVLAIPNWEELTLEYGHYLIDGSGNIVVNPGPPLVPMSAPNYDCPGEGGSWLGDMFSGIGDFFSGIGEWVSGIFGDGEGGGSGGNGSGNGGGPPGGGGNWGPGNGYGDGGYGSSGPNPGGGGSNPGGGGPVGGSGAGWEGGNGSPDPDPGGPVFPLVIDGGSISGVGTIAVNEVPDNNGFLPSRITALQVYLQSKKDGMLDCNEINSLPMGMYQDVGSYQVPQSVLNRIQDIRNSYPSIFNTDNFKIQSINEATGPVVNLDYFPVHITELPYNSNHVRMTADEFLEYFRNNINFFISLGGGNVVFSPYIQSPFSDHTKWLTPYEGCVGSIVHISIPTSVPGVSDDGTVVVSGYSRNQSTNSHSFRVTTMESPLDGEHPVAGNRVFGIMPDVNNGGYCFYIMGVDRTFGSFVSFMNNTFNSAFAGADQLWTGVQSGVISHLNSSNANGAANLYTPNHTIARPKWNNIVKKFLQGQINLLQMKLLLHCP